MTKIAKKKSKSKNAYTILHLYMKSGWGANDDDPMAGGAPRPPIGAKGATSEIRSSFLNFEQPKKYENGNGIVKNGPYWA